MTVICARALYTPTSSFTWLYGKEKRPTYRNIKRREQVRKWQQRWRQAIIFVSVITSESYRWKAVHHLHCFLASPTVHTHTNTHTEPGTWPTSAHRGSQPSRVTKCADRIFRLRDAAWHLVLAKCPTSTPRHFLMWNTRETDLLNKGRYAVRGDRVPSIHIM